jgi:outer membrane protein assembly factor BamE
MMRLSVSATLAILLVLPTLAACSGSGGITSYLTPHRIDIRQGNMVTQEMVSQLKPGQTKDQVRFILGTPMVADMFHADRWDYVYRFVPGRNPDDMQKRHLVVFFENGKLVRVDGDVVANNPEKPGDEPARSTARVIEIAPAKAPSADGNK